MDKKVLIVFSTDGNQTESIDGIVSAWLLRNQLSLQYKNIITYCYDAMKFDYGLTPLCDQVFKQDYSEVHLIDCIIPKQYCIFWHRDRIPTKIYLKKSDVYSYVCQNRELFVDFDYTGRNYLSVSRMIHNAFNFGIPPALIICVDEIFKDEEKALLLHFEIGLRTRLDRLSLFKEDRFNLAFCWFDILSKLSRVELFSKVNLIK